MVTTLRLWGRCRGARGGSPSDLLRLRAQNPRMGRFSGSVLPASRAERASAVRALWGPPAWPWLDRSGAWRARGVPRRLGRNGCFRSAPPVQARQLWGVVRSGVRL